MCIYLHTLIIFIEGHDAAHIDVTHDPVNGIDLIRVESADLGGIGRDSRLGDIEPPLVISAEGRIGRDGRFRDIKASSVCRQQLLC